MSTIVFTLSGQDRVGIVDEITRTLLELGANIETSRMARLGGEFAILMLVTLPDGREEQLQRATDQLSSRGYKVTTVPTRANGGSVRQGRPYHLEVEGADHEGIVNKIARTLAGWGINIETMDTGNTPAPNSGIPLFTMKALVMVPAELDERLWREELDNTANEEHVDVMVRPA
jgi:glycine cleavage system transcriptional repressor